MIWEVLLPILMYAAPIMYPITMMSEHFRRIILLNPLAFIINFAKQGLISNQFTSCFHFAILFLGVMAIAIISFVLFNKYEKRVAEFI